jgi:HEAT repeat protein
LLLPQLISAFPRIRNAQGRNIILFTMLRHARSEPAVLELAMQAASDPAYLVRMQACGILAYALDRRAIPCLAALLTHRDAKTREDAAAAIAAIEAGNHHLWIDRDGAGRQSQ